MKGWQVKKLGEVCDFENGDRGKNYPSKSAFVQSGVPFVNAGHLSVAGIDMSEMNFIPRQRFNLLTNGKIQKNDILFCLRGSLGKFAPVNDLVEGAIASSLVIIRPRHFALRDFILAYLSSSLCAEMIEKFRNGAAQPNLSAKNLADFEIPLPPLDEQRRIVAILDEAFAGLAVMRQHAEANLKNARALFDSHLNAIFSQRGDGWVETTLRDVCDQITDGTHQTPTYFDDGYIFLSSKSVTSGAVNWKNSRFIDRAQHVAMQKRVSPKLNDILLAKNGTTGVAALVDRDIEFDIYVSLALLRPKTSMSPKFMLYFINSPAAKEQFNKRLKGVGVPNLHLEEIRQVTIPFPHSRDVQNQIAMHLDEIRIETARLESLYRQKLAAIDELKQSILHRAFSGQLSREAIAA